DRPKAGHDLQHSREQSPQWSQRDMEDVKTDQPEHSHGNRVLELSHGPLFERASGGAQMIPNIHRMRLHRPRLTGGFPMLSDAGGEGGERFRAESRAPCSHVLDVQDAPTERNRMASVGAFASSIPSDGDLSTTASKALQRGRLVNFRSAV